MTSCSRKHNLHTQSLSHFQYGHLQWCICQGWRVRHRTYRRPACFWTSSWTQVVLPGGKWQLAWARAAELCPLPKQRKKHWNSSVFIKSHIISTQCMGKELHNAAVTLLGRRWGFCPSYNRGSQTEAWGIHKHNLSKDQLQRSAQRGWQQDAHVKAKEGSRTRGMAGTGAISPARSCSRIPLQTLPPLPLLEPLLPNPLLAQGVELAQTPIDPRSCFWATLTKSAIMHTSFHIYAKSIHPTHISTVFEALCSLGRSGWILPRIHNLVLIIPSCWALEHRAFSSRTTTTRANGLLCYQEANPLQSTEDPAPLKVPGKAQLHNNRRTEFVNSSGKERASPVL